MGKEFKFVLEPYHRNIPDEDLLQDVRDVAKKTGRNTVTQNEYNKYGRYGLSTLVHRFHSWFNMLNKAGLQESCTQKNMSNEELFINMRNVWIALQRQPRYDEFKKPLSKYSTFPYEKRFGSWRKALEAFITYVNEDSSEELEDENNNTNNPLIDTEGTKLKRNTKRSISERLRFKILLRDGFTCQSCGKSPLKSRDIELHVDHIVPWSKGGETELDNLITKCRDCNLGKGNMFEK